MKTDAITIRYYIEFELLPKLASMPDDHEIDTDDILDHDIISLIQGSISVDNGL